MTISGQADRLSLSAGSGWIQPILLEELLDSRGAQFCAWTKAEGWSGLRFFRKNISNLNVAVRLCTAHCNIQAKNLSQVWNGKINAKDS